jgi:serine/threonine protein phosphatase PrpC
MTGTPATGELCACAVEGAAARTDSGLLRAVNEDSVLLREWPGGNHAILAVIADGMGSYGGGDAASAIVVDTFADLLGAPLPSDRAARCEALLGAFYVADERIREAGGQRFPEMGATAVAAIVTPGELVHLYAGDCRLYLMRGGDIIYRTHDHSAVQVLVDSGRISAEQARGHHMRSLVTSCLGGPNVVGRLTVDPPLSLDENGDEHFVGGPFHEIDGGDRIILCSDGLWGEIGDDELVEALRRHQEPGECDALVQDYVRLANQAGGSDNISVIAISALDRMPGRITGSL